LNIINDCNQGMAAVVFIAKNREKAKRKRREVRVQNFYAKRNLICK